MALTTVAGAGAGLTQEKGSPGGFKYDKKAPIEITSSNLEVRQAENLAVFTGNVVAGQGTLRLTADSLNVHYNDAGGETGAIERIVAAGNVLLCNGSETAEGETGAYDVAAGRIRMEGSVVLAQGGNAIAGPRLEIDLNTGVGRVIGAPGKPVRTLLIPARTGNANPKAAFCDG